MADIKEYVNKDGYRIRATARAYEMYYAKQGFRLVSPQAEPQTDASESYFASMKTADLKKYLAERGILFGTKAKREELVALAEAADRCTGADAGTEDPEEDAASDPGPEEE